MAPLLAERVERPRSLFGRAPEVPVPARATVTGRRARGHDGGLGGGLTLDDAIVGVWEGLAAQVTVACPLCGGALRPSSAPDAVGGRCGDCGTELE